MAPHQGQKSAAAAAAESERKSAAPNDLNGGGGGGGVTPAGQKKPPPPPSGQRNPNRMLKLSKGNTEVRDGKCHILYRSEMDPRWPSPQFIDETYIDRNRLESLNLQYLNPDVVVRNHVKCICTRVIHLREDWYVQNHEGTILCVNCARCFRCRVPCTTAARKLNSIDGFVLCNTCMLSYGCYREPKLRIRLQPLSRTLEDAADSASDTENENEASGAGNFSNCENISICSFGKSTNEEGSSSSSSSRFTCRNSDNNNCCSNNSCSGKADQFDNDSVNNHLGGGQRGGGSEKPSVSGRQQPSSGSQPSRHQQLNQKPASQELLDKPRYRDEGRRPLRKILYPNPRPENFGRPDYRQEAPPYLGVDRNNGGQVCPECGHQALAEALVVPGSARVYHERSFRCANCKRPMHMGYQLPMVQFNTCSCAQQEQPKVYCSENACQLARQAHHEELDCLLEPVHPGGRPTREVPGWVARLDPAAEAKTLNKLLRRQERQQERQQEQQQEQQQKP